MFCNGQSGTAFTVKRLSQPQLLVRPDSGRVLTRVLVNGADVTGSVQGGYYTLPAVYEDLTLQVETGTAAPVYGDRYIVQGKVTRNGAPVSGITLGYMEFYLTEDITTYLGVSGGAQVIYVDKSGIGVDLVLQLEDNGLLTPLQASTIPAPVSAQTPAGETPPATPPAQTTAPTFRIPQTGDAARPALLLVLALCSAVLFVLLWRKKDKK